VWARDNWCACDACWVSPTKMSQNCDLAKLGLVGFPRKEVICEATSVAHRSESARAPNSFDQFAESLGTLLLKNQLSNVVVIRIQPDDPEPDDQDYHLARVTKKPWQLAEDGTIGQQGSYPAGTLVLKMKWYELTTMIPYGDRTYRIASAYAEEVWPVASLIQVRSSSPVQFSRQRPRGYYSSLIKLTRTY